MNVQINSSSFMQLHAMSYHASQRATRQTDDEQATQLNQHFKTHHKQPRVERSEDFETFHTVRHEEMDRFRMEMKALRNEYKEEFKTEKEGLVKELRAEGADKHVIRQEVRALRDEFHDDFKELREERKETLQESLNGLGEDIRELRQQFREDFREAKNDLREETGESGDRNGLRDAIRELRKEFREDFFEARQEKIDAFRNEYSIETDTIKDHPVDTTPPETTHTPEVVTAPVVPPYSPPVVEEPVNPNDEVTASQIAHQALSDSENTLADMEVMVSDAYDGGAFNSEQFTQLQQQLQQDLQTYQNYIDNRTNINVEEPRNLLAQIDGMSVFSIAASPNNADLAEILDRVDSAGGLLSQELNQYGNAEKLAAAYSTNNNTDSSATTDATSSDSIVINSATAQSLIDLLTEQLSADNSQSVTIQANVLPAGALSLLS